LGDDAFAVSLRRSLAQIAGDVARIRGADIRVEPSSCLGCPYRTLCRVEDYAGNQRSL
ncbi:MAG: hypothetical protein HQL11_05760, partial [Candidatus Omnitrophica bacterium]|nr:hypothetical protein [Candidatus Omnitrophota bacterium]